VGQHIELIARDGHTLAGYLAEPAGTPRGGLLILQEFFGVNAHIRRIVDDYARDGYIALAPALFDRVERSVDLPYDESGMKRGRELRAMLNVDNTLLDIAAAIDELRRRTASVGAVGYCWGGVLAYLASLKLDGLDAIVAYYGATIPDYIGEPTRIPILLHFSEHDDYMQPGDPERIAAAHPEIELFVYPGTEHGFNCDVRQYYDRDAAGLALQRTLAFLETKLG
jgi:carboxymethylenebutenolidase